jgi:hypothetical protein
MVLVLEIVVFVWGLRMIFKRSDEGWNLDNSVGVMMVAGAVVVEVIWYWFTHRIPHYF